jgi:hypothetical protein
VRRCCPGLIRGEIKERQLAQAGVFRVLFRFSHRGVAGPQYLGEDLPGTVACTVITGGDERGEPVADLPPSNQ